MLSLLNRLEFLRLFFLCCSEPGWTPLHCFSVISQSSYIQGKFQSTNAGLLQILPLFYFYFSVNRIDFYFLFSLNKPEYLTLSVFVWDPHPLIIDKHYKSGAEKLAITSCFQSMWRLHCLLENETLNEKCVCVCVCVCFARKYFMKSNSTFSLHCCDGAANNANATSSRILLLPRFICLKR